MTSKNSLKTVKSMVLPDHFTEAGIKSELTQNDVIEIIANKKIETIFEQLDALYFNHQSIVQLRQQFELEQVSIFNTELGKIAKEELFELPGKNIKPVLVNPIENSTDKKTPSLLQIVYLKGKKMLSVDENGEQPLNENCFLYMAISFYDKVSEDIQYKGIKHQVSSSRSHSLEKKVQYPKKFMQDFNKVLLKHCDNVNSFYNKYKGFDLEAENIIKTIRTKFNTKLLKAKSPLLHSQIEALFEVKL